MTPVVFEKWTTLNRREKRMVSIAAVMVFAALVWFVAIEPAMNGIAKTQKDLPKLRQDAALVSAYALEVRRLNATSRPNAVSATWLNDLERSLERATLKGNSKLEGTASQPQVQMKSVAFAPFAEWVSTGPKELGLKVSGVKVERLGAGLVNVDIRLEAPGTSP